MATPRDVSADQGFGVNIELTATPRLAAGVRLGEAAQQPRVLLLPERAFRLNASSLAIIELCDGTHTVQQITEMLQAKYAKAEPAQIAKDVLAYLEQLHEARAIDL
jgi:pyrroloquinoline quinone biosynthesis protein D